MEGKRREFSAAFKPRLVRAVLRENWTLAEPRASLARPTLFAIICVGIDRWSS